MAITKILKNVSGSTRNILNRELANNESYTIPHNQWAKAIINELTIADIVAGLVVVNNGTSDLSPSAGLVHLLKYDTSANYVTFDNSSNGYLSTDAQAAIEESKAEAILKPRFSITTTFNATLSNNEWLGYNEHIPGDQVPIRIPLDCRLREVTVAYKNTDLLGIPVGGNLIDGRLQIYKNGLTDPTHVVHTETFTNQASGRVISGLDVFYAAGDFLVSKWKDDGDNPSDVAIVYFFQAE